MTSRRLNWVLLFCVARNTPGQAVEHFADVTDPSLLQMVRRNGHSHCDGMLDKVSNPERCALAGNFKGEAIT